jgi:cell shape-determining protein MreC
MNWLIILNSITFLLLVFFAIVAIINFKKSTKLQKALNTKNEKYDTLLALYNELCETVEKLQKDFNEVDSENQKRIEELEKAFDELIAGRLKDLSEGEKT